ncbi:hypothetical protein SYNPS1DRAFT_24250 [Syncephalis pseudoplumigaleata]|uniref:Membrane anchor Opy2 N-terminal domain-containing protein n=1 Tax=Syncephalis pseudoplumigaleata TaxID=1712513 RepID=A0A4P9YXJ2_9FUNG|nr:hypothetical protein SYNPS1DRAFT_24250 [Syncephalis pseudoplumigaleata]|eukprot:RKP23680.1 hypothetical protein SYNPS1DRAFT_24250 [Syncephalis pseudoplumigaleata]
MRAIIVAVTFAACLGLLLPPSGTSAALLERRIICTQGLIDCKSCPEGTECVDIPGTPTSCPQRKCEPKACKMCLLIAPQCTEPCPEGQECKITDQTCHQCAEAKCVPKHCARCTKIAVQCPPTCPKGTYCKKTNQTCDKCAEAKNGTDIRKISTKAGAGNHNWGKLENAVESMEGIDASTAQQVAANLDHPPLGHSLVNPSKATETYDLPRSNEDKEREPVRASSAADTPRDGTEDTKIKVVDEESFERLRQAMRS